MVSISYVATLLLPRDGADVVWHFWQLASLNILKVCSTHIDADILAAIPGAGTPLGDMLLVSPVAAVVGRVSANQLSDAFAEHDET